MHLQSHISQPWHLWRILLLMLVVGLSPNSCSAFSPISRVQLKNAVVSCLKQSPRGRCLDGPRGPIGTWDVSRVTDMSRMFSGATLFDSDITKWDVSRVNNMRDMFKGATSFNGDLSRWDVSNVNDMQGMFLGATVFKRNLCGSAWVYSKAKQTSMFEGSPGSISRTVCTATTFAPKSRAHLSGAIGTYLKFSRNEHLRTDGAFCRPSFTRTYSFQPRMQTDVFDTITIFPKSSKPIAGVVFLHGLGDTSKGWAETCSQLNRLQPSLANVKWVLPTAEMRPVAINNWQRMPSWFDITESFDFCPGIDIARERIQKIVSDLADEVGGMSRVVLGGFSQGGALSLYTGLQMDGQDPLAGLIVMSGGFALEKKFPRLLTTTETPVLICHGEEDQMVPYKSVAIPTYDKLKALRLKVDFKSYKNLAHEASIPELEDVASWLVKRLNPTLIVTE